MNSPGVAFDVSRDFLNRDLSYLDPIDLPRLSLRDFIKSQTDAVWIERDGGSHTDAHYGPMLHHKNGPNGLSDIVSQFSYERPACLMQVRHDVLISGYRCVVTSDGKYSFDETYAEADRLAANENLASAHQYLNEMIGFVPGEMPNTYRLGSPRKTIQIDEPVIFISSNEAPNFGAFIYRVLPKVVQVSKLDASLKILFPPQFDSFKQLLIAAGISEDRLIPHWIDHWYRLKKVYVPGVRSPQVFFDSESLALFDGLRLRHGSPRSGRRIYLTRRKITDHPRQMINEKELLTALEKKGFEFISPEDLSATEQISLFSSAEIIVAAAGSAIYNAVFCYPGTKFLDIESEPHWIRGHVRIFSSCQLDYCVFEASTLRQGGEPHQPFTVDVPELVRILDDFLSMTSPA